MAHACSNNNYQPHNHQQQHSWGWDVAVRSIQTGLFILKGAAAAYFSVDRGRFVAKTQKGQTT